MAIDGFASFPSARHSAGRALETHPDPDAAINALITQHIALAGANGFVTNLGGFVTMLVSAPANLAGLAVTHARLVAGIAHLRGYDLNDSRVRHAILTTLLGKKIVDDLVAKGELPGTPLVLATAPGLDRSLEQSIAQRVMMAMLTVSGGKKLIGLTARRIPIIGGGIGAVTDGWNTRAVASYAKEQFVSRRAG